MRVDLAEDERQRAADVAAVMVLARMSMLNTEPDFSGFGSMVAAFCAKQSPETLQTYSAMSWEKAIREMKIAFAKHYLAAQQAGPDELPPPEVDQQIGRTLIAAFFKFVTFRSIMPDWYAPHLEGTRVAGAPVPQA